MKLIDFRIIFKESYEATAYPVVEGFTEHNNFMEIHLPENKVVMVDKGSIQSIKFIIDESEDEEQPQLRLV